MKFRHLILLPALLISVSLKAQHSKFVSTSNHQFLLQGKPFYFIGTNYWYGSSLGQTEKGLARLKTELDFLKSNGITTLRVLAGSEGSGLVNGIIRVEPSLQYEKGRFDSTTLNGMDVLLHEMEKRDLKAVIMLSNNWEWSGGFLQYLLWNKQIEDSVFRRKLNWDEMRDYISKFYSCAGCITDYRQQVSYILSRKNSITGKKYIDDEVIMAWELANEPRPMRPHANEAYAKWINDMSSYIKSIDSNHLVTTGHEGEIGTQSMELFREIHKGKSIDYLTIHIWPKNWAWFRDGKLSEDFSQVVKQTNDYINKHIAVAAEMQKPLVLEEFGLPRDNQSFDVNSTTSLRDAYFAGIFSIWKKQVKSKGPLAGVMFWAFGGTARPVPGQVFWKKGDDYMGDPPMEEQGLNTIFDSDRSTWNMIRAFY